MYKISAKIELTFTKLLSLLMLIICSLYGFIYKDSDIIIAGFGSATALLLNREYQYRMREKYIKEKENVE